MSARRTSCLLRVSQRGTITLPREYREGFDEDTVVEAIRRDDGVIELRPKKVIDAEQGWFWTERWQRMEREAEADIAAGRTRRTSNADAFLADLDADATD